MIQEAYCSYEVSKLLREKGFDEPCRSYFTDGTDYCYCTYDCDERTDINLGVFDYLRPTHQMAMKWLREEKNIIVNVWYDGNDFNAECYNNEDENFYLITDGSCNSYEEAVEAALKYVLENLV